MLIFWIKIISKVKNDLTKLLLFENAENLGWLPLDDTKQRKRSEWPKQHLCKNLCRKANLDNRFLCAGSDVQLVNYITIHCYLLICCMHRPLQLAF